MGSAMTPDHSPEYFLASSRLFWRFWREEDLPLARALWGDTRVTALIVAGGTLDDEQVRARLEHELTLQRQHDIAYWPVFKRDSGAFAGACGLRPYAGEPDTLELGIHLLPQFWGAGLATEACRRVIRHAFEERGVGVLFAGHHPRNDASRALLAKLGFRRVREEFYQPTGLLHPSYLMTREEYRPTPDPDDPRWRDLAALIAGTPRQRDAAKLLADAAILDKLAPWDAVLCGTIPIDCDIASSDLDVICHAPDAATFAAALETFFAGEDGYHLKNKDLIGIPSVICRFTRAGWPVEIVGQPLPVRAQRAWRHMLAEALLLAGAPAGANDRIRALRAEGLSTEEAFGRHFGLPGDPYEALLELYDRTWPRRQPN